MWPLKISYYFASTLWLLTEKLLVLILSFAVTLAVARHLLPGDFGRLSFLMALVSLMAPLMALGLNSLISRELLRRPADNDQIIGSAMALRCSIGLVIAILASFIGYRLMPSGDGLLLSLLLFASVANAALIIDFWLQAHLANRHAALLRLGVLVLFSVLRIAAVALSAELAVFAYLVAAEFIVLGIGYLFVYQRKSNALPRLCVSKKECCHLIVNGRWLFMSGIAAVLYLKIDQVMLGLMIDERAVGVYAIAAKFSEVWYFVPAALVTSYFPLMIDTRARDPNAYMLGLQKLNDFLFTAALLIALLTTATADWLIPIIFGEAYDASVSVLLVHIWAALLVFMRALLSKWLIVEDLLALSLLSQGAGALINVALNYYLIPLYGPLGAAYATVLSYAVAGYLILFVHPDLRPMARIVSRSLALPYRLARHGRALYVR